MTDVSLAAAFIAGLVSFLSPCVLPLVPGYISMLSGIGMEQLRQGQQPRGGLFASALSFVVGFSVVFISFGASASAVGTFLLKNRGMLAPIAGALILLFGLHLVGVLVKLTFRTGLIVGSLLVILGVAAILHHGPLFFGLGWVHFFSLSLIGFFGPGTRKVAQPRRAFRSTSTKPGLFSGFFLGFAFAFRVDSVHRADSCHGACARRCQRHNCAGNSASGGLLRRLGRALPADRAGHRTISQVLPALPKISARRRSA